MGFKFLIVLTVILSALAFYANYAVAVDQNLNEFQKETITSIREITLQLILIAMGIFALFGSFATAADRTFKAHPLIWTAFLLLGTSVVMGLFAYGNLTWTLGKGQFDPFGTVEALAKWQWVFFGIGGLIFGIYVLLNIKRK